MGQVSSNLAETFIIWPLIFLLVEKKKAQKLSLSVKPLGSDISFLGWTEEWGVEENSP